MQETIVLYVVLLILTTEHFEKNTDDRLNNIDVNGNFWNASSNSKSRKTELSVLTWKTTNIPINNISPAFANATMPSTNRQSHVNENIGNSSRTNNRYTINTDYGIERSNCLHMPVYMSLCPTGFTQLSESGTILCYKIMERQRFPPLCPYPHHLPFYKIVGYLRKHFTTRSIWLYARRDASTGFPQFEWIEAGLNFKTTVKQQIINAGHTIDRNCLIFKNGRIYRVSCFRKYDALCIYSISDLKKSNIITLCKQQGYASCIVSDYDLSPPKCFCKKLDLSQPEKHAFCKKLAEPVYPFQTQLLSSYDDNSKYSCWIGLYKPKTTSLCKWWTTDEDVTYTSWYRPETCDFSEGAFIFGSIFNGWYLANDRTLPCALCEVEANLKSIELQLRYFSRENKLQLLIYNFASVGTVHDTSVYCFSDTNLDDFKSTVKIDYNDKERVNSGGQIKAVWLDTSVKRPGYYWCEAFQYNNSINPIRSNIVLAYNKNEYGNEFSINVAISISWFEDPFIADLHVKKCKDIFQYVFPRYPNLLFVRPMRGHLDESNHVLSMLVHITTKKTSQSAGKEYESLYGILKNVPYMKITHFRSSEVCLPNITKTSDDEILTWPETAIGATAIPGNRLCLDIRTSMAPVTRQCKGNFLYGAQWEPPIGDCTKNTTYSEVTEELFDLTKQNTSAENITTDLIRITREDKNKHTIDVHLISLIMEDLASLNDEKVNNNNFSNIISNIMDFKETSVQEAQRLLNSTDKILSALDDFMKTQGPLLIVFPKLIVYINVLETDGVGGLALYNKTKDEGNFKFYEIEVLYQNASFESLLTRENLQTVVLIPNTTIDYIKERLPKNETAKFIIMVFYNDLLFTEKEQTSNPHSKTKIVSVLVPGYVGFIYDSIKMAFRMPKRYSNTKLCSYWDYGLNSLMVSTYGKWKSDTMSNKTHDFMEVCEFSHMTHFGLLLQGSPKEILPNELVLDILTAIGSALSLLGIVPIFITAFMFKTWRCRPGNIILINFCIAITIQIVILFSMNAINEDGTACIFLGAGLHYIILSEFCWMFVIALLQHRRFVLVFKPQDDNIVKRCLIIGWGLPLLPVVITISISTENYAMTEQKFCTVIGTYYIFAYFLPIIIILVSNAFMFAKIIYNVSRRDIESCAKRNRNYRLEILLALFLFFVLGMTWIFGIIGAFGGGEVFTYLFCISATLRGLVLFVFFIIGNKETRLMWNKRYVYYLTKKWKRMGGSTTPSANTTVVSNE